MSGFTHAQLLYGAPASGGAAPTVQGRNANALSFVGGGILAVNLPSGIVAGDLIFVQVTGGDSGIAPTAPGYTLFNSYNPGGNNSRMSQLARIATGDANDACNAVVGVAGGQWISAFSWRIQGVSSLSRLLGLTAATDNSLSVKPPAISASTEPFLMIIMGQLGGLATISSYPSGYSNGRTTTGNASAGFGGVCAAEKTCPAGPETPGSMPFPVGSWASSASVAVRADP